MSPTATTLSQLLERCRLPLSPLVCIQAAVLLFITIYLVTWKLRGPLPPDHPPLVPSRIPWLGHAIPFLRDNNGLIERVKNHFPSHGIITLTLAGRPLYLVTEVDLAAQIYRQSRTFAFDPLTLLLYSTFGCEKGDMRILEKGAQDYSLKSWPKSQCTNGDQRGSEMRDGNEKPGLLMELHRLSTEHLMGSSLDRMTAVFVQTLSQGIDSQFPAAEASSYEWRELELVSFVKKHWTRASIVSLFGSHILSLWPDVGEWIWEFDVQVQMLMTGLPSWWLFPAAWRAREVGLQCLERWEGDAKKASKEGPDVSAEEVGGGEVVSGEWDPYWGLRFLRERAAVAEEYGLSARGRAVLQLALFWGQNANAIPAATWLTIQALSPTTPDLLPTLLSEVQNATIPNPPSSSSSAAPNINFPTLLLQPHLKSLLQETYRWSVSSPGVRVVQEETRVGRYTLTKGSIVMVHARTLHMDEKTWNPRHGGATTHGNTNAGGRPASEFDAGRFLDEGDEGEVDWEGGGESMTAAAQGEKGKERERRMKKERVKMSSMRHFGGGRNLCPGRFFATNQILGGFAVLMGLLEMVTLDDDAVASGGGSGVPGVRLGDGKQGGLWPDGAVRVRVRRRRGV